MLVDRSARIWAMRHDDMGIAAAAAQRAARHDGQPATAAVGAPLQGSDFASVIDGVALVPVRGLLMRSMSRWFWSYEEIARDIALAQADPRVKAIVLDVDSPGGLVSGCADAAAAIRASGPKPVEAFVGGLGASAAYWIASAARRVTVGSGAVLGSIGSVIEYVDVEPMFEKMGARIVRVVAAQSPNKRLDPESPEGRAELQALVDASGAEFVAAVARQRGVPEDSVLARFGQGLVFDGAEAVRRGMADRRGTLEELIAELAGRDPKVNAAPAAAAKEETRMDWDSMTAAALREHRADIAEEIAAAAAAEAEAKAEERIAAAVAAERERILAIDEIAVEGHEALVEAAKKDGKTTAAELALQIVKADRKSGELHLRARSDADALATVPAAPQGGQTVISGGSVEDRSKAEWDRDEVLRAEFGGDFAAYVAFQKAKAEGRARLLSRAN